MFVIGLNPGVTPTQMSAALGLEGAQIATMLNKLELRRLITRRVSKSDGRSRAVHLTATGKAEFKQLRKVSTQVERSFLADTLNEAEAAQLGALLARLVASLED
jgi:DNA-binding MarR family transcriptional regulator